MISKTCFQTQENQVNAKFHIHAIACDIHMAIQAIINKFDTRKYNIVFAFDSDFCNIEEIGDFHNISQINIDTNMITVHYEVRKFSYILYPEYEIPEALMIAY